MLFRSQGDAAQAGLCVEGGFEGGILGAVGVAHQVGNGQTGGPGRLDGNAGAVESDAGLAALVAEGSFDAGPGGGDDVVGERQAPPTLL